MNGDYYKTWLKVTDPEHPRLELWGGLIIWIIILIVSSGIFFLYSHWWLIIVIWSLFAISYWGKLIISQWRYSHDKEEQKQFERERKEDEQEAYRNAIVQLKEVKQLIDEFLKRGDELRYKNMKQVSPGVWIDKDSTMEEVLKWLKEIIPPNE